MPRFLIPPEMTLYRPSTGLLKDGAVVTLPDADSKPGDRVPLGLIPLDKAAHALLEESAEQAITAEELRLAELEPPQKMKEAAKKVIRARVRAVPADPEAAANPAKPAEEHLTVRQAAERAGSLTGKTGRAADR